ncbi:MAG: hypothetical protein Q7R85_02350 [bacterium]|nr:hypothetical protein [bacterium]
MENIDQYKALLSEVIAKEAVILGPDIAILKARNVAELAISDKGEVTDITGNPDEAVQKLIEEYVNLSGLIVKNVTKSIFEKYQMMQPKK